MGLSPWRKWKLLLDGREGSSLAVMPLAVTCPQNSLRNSLDLALPDRAGGGTSHAVSKFRVPLTRLPAAFHHLRQFAMCQFSQSRIILRSLGRSAIALLLLLCAADALAQAVPPKSASDLTFAEQVEQLQAGKRQLDGLHDLDEAAKVKARDLYDQALQETAKAKNAAARAATFAERAAQAPAELAQTKASLHALSEPAGPTIPAGASLPQIEREISRRQADLEGWRRDLAHTEAQLKQGPARRTEIPVQISAAQQVLANLNAALQAPPSAHENTAVTAARRAMLSAKRRAAEQELLCCQNERKDLEARAELWQPSHDLCARRIALAEQELKQWQALADRRRQHEAEQQAKEAKREAAQADPAVRQLARTNARLAEDREQLAHRIAETTGQSDQANRQLADLQAQFAGARQKVKAVGLTHAIGVLLRKQRETLPKLSVYRRNVNHLQRTIRDEQLVVLELQDQRAPLADLDCQTQAVLQKLGAAPPGDDRVELGAQVHDALRSQRQYLDSLLADHRTYFDKLVDLDNAERQLIRDTVRFRQYIDERVLWIGSAPPLRTSDVRCAGDALWWLAEPPSWLAAGRTLIGDVKLNPDLWIVVAGVLAALVYWRRRLRARIAVIGEKAARSNCYRFLPTVEAFLLTLLVAGAWPALLGYVGWRLSAADDAPEVCQAAGAGLIAAAGVYLLLELFRHTCAAKGLAEAHFGWPAAAQKTLRRNVGWLSLPALLLVFVAATMGSQANAHWDRSLGRIAFMAALLCGALFARQVLRPAGGVFQAMVAARRGGWLDRLRHLWYLLGVLTPVALAVLAAAGYYYTAEQLAVRLVMSVYLLLGATVLRGLLLRWVVVNKRNLAIEEARQRRAAQNEARRVENAPAAAGPPAPETPQHHLATINAQTRRLIEYSVALAVALVFWCAWVDLLPALGILHRVEVWQTTVSVTENTVGPDGKTVQTRVTERPVAITLANLGLALLALATTVIAAKNIPGLLEMAVLEHLPLDAGARYAVAAVSRYLIVLVGVLMCFSELGVGWSKVQWLVAGMGVGLGFGLQEIFANFISGLIILFERPVRVGDVVTIDEVNGVVSRIRMRATTITDWDRRELIIPNKAFITGRVLNWTLTEPVIRVAINVGVAYGSDTERTADILLKLAQNHPHVLRDPPPRVMLESFGDSALNFALRCFLRNVHANINDRAAVIHDLHMGIDREFRRAGIEIAFPQQDVHVRSIDFPPAALQPGAGANRAPWSAVPPPPVAKAG